MNRKLIIIGIILVTLTVAFFAFLLMGDKTQPDVAPEPAAAITPTTTPTIDPDRAAYGEDAHDAEIPAREAAFPANQHLPHFTLFWTLAFDSWNDKLVLEARVYYDPGTTPEAEIVKQQPFIEQWLASVGQQPGTYELKLVAEERVSY